MDATTQHHEPKHVRVEDNVLVRGHGRYVADAPLPNQAYAYFVRSPHAFARIVSVDTAAARNAPGVVGVLTAKDMDGVGNLGRHPPIPGRGGKGLILPHRPALAGERVMHIGEPVAMVVAESAAAAQDAAELVTVEYEEMTPVTDAREALRDGAPQVWPQAPGNLAVDWPGPNPDPDGNAKKVDEIFASAKHVAKVAQMNQRMMVHSMEPRGATASYDPATDSYLTRTCSQGAGAMREPIMAIMSLPKEKVRVLTEDVGGAFGLKTGPYPENIALLVGAKKFGRPIHWMSSRSEAFLSDNQARDIYSEAELALDDKGKFLALRVRNVGNLGAYVGPVGANIPTANFTRCLPGMYDIKYMDVSAKCAFTNTIPTAPYRGAGRPEASYILERVVDEAARVTGIDPAKLRRRNLIKKSAMPYKTAVGTTYDCGDFEPILDKALALGRLRRLQETPPRIAKARQISRLWHLLPARAFRRRAGGERQAELSRRRHAVAHAQCAEHRPGPCHGFPARDRRKTRHSGGQNPACPRRFLERAARLCVGRLALGDDRRPFHRQGDGHHPAKGQADRRHHAGNRRSRHRL